MKRFKPLLLTFLVVLFDQLSKAWVVKNIRENTIGYSFFNDFLQIIHVRNNAVAFSIGQTLSQNIRAILFILVPIIFVGYLLYLLLSNQKVMILTNFQRWILAGLVGGGLGNLIDRIFRGFRVVDFISNACYGFLGFERWPTWNIADATVVCCGILLMISIIIEEKKRKDLKDE